MLAAGVAAVVAGQDEVQDAELAVAALVEVVEDGGVQYGEEEGFEEEEDGQEEGGTELWAAFVHWELAQSLPLPSPCPG